MNRISQFIKAGAKGKLLIPFFTAGYPSLNDTIDLVLTAEAAGASIVEIGLPFSDPLADGPEVQYSSYYALNHGTQFGAVMKTVEKIRRQTDIPLIFMGYYNPLIAWKENRFLTVCADVGIDGLIIPDLPVEESEKFREGCRKHSLATIFLAAPTSSEKRIKAIDRCSTGFVYAVTVTGVTGTGKVFDRTTDKYLEKLRSTLKSKFVAGFGVSDGKSAQRLALRSDGIVIGSAIVKLLRNARSRRERRQVVEKFLTSVRKAIA